MKRLPASATRMILAVCALVVADLAYAATYEFRDRNRDNDYLGSSTWKTNNGISVATSPGSGDSAYVTSGTGHDVKVTVPGDVSVDFNYLVFKAQDSSSFKFYTTGSAHTFELPYSEGAKYSTSWALGLQTGDGAAYATVKTATSAGPCCSWTDPYFTLSSASDHYPTFVASRGTYDFLTACGYDTAANTFKMNNRGGEIIFGTNVVVKLPKVEIDHSNARLRFRGSQATWGASFDVKAGHVEVSDDATVSVSQNVQVYGSTIPSMTISNTAFTTSKNLFVGLNSNGKLIVENGADVKISGGDAIQVGHNAGGGGVEVRGGKLNTGRIRLARGGATSDKTAYFRQTGGTTTLTGDGIQFQQSCTGNNLGTHYVQLDGGVLEAKAIFRDDTVTAGTVYLSGNGGRYKAYAAGNLAYNLSYSEFGEKGLTVDTAGKACTFDVDGRNKSGANGLFVKAGAGTLTLAPPSSWTVSRTVVSNGTLKVTGGETLETALCVEPGAALSTVGTASAVALDSLAVTNATLALDPGDVITVTGPVSVRGLVIDWSSVPSVEKAFLVVSGEMDDGTKAAISSAIFANALSEGTHAAFRFSYDAGTGKTTVSASVAADVPLTDSVRWTGSGAWATPGNWEGGATPTDAQIASFTSSSAGKTVTVAVGDKAGALEFGTDGYTLSGVGPLVIAGDVGAAAISAMAGANTIDVPLVLSSLTAIPVEAGASLAITKPISYGGIAKAGTGKLTLGADNSPENGVTSSDGILEATAAGAFGQSSADNVTLRSGTVQFAGANGAAMHIPANFSVAATSSTDLVVFKADTDTTIDTLDVVQGAICKRGIGKLTVNIPADTTYKLAWSGSGTVGSKTMQDWFPSGSAGVEFPADGTAPDPAGGLYPGFSVAEGELAFVGTGPNAKVNMNYARTLVGLYAKTCAVQPMLTVDNVTCECLNNGGIFLGHNVGTGSVGVTNPVLRIVNGGTVRIGYAQMGYGSTSSRSFITVAATNGTFIVADSGHYLTRMWGNNGAKAYYRFKDSRHYFDGANKYIGGGIDLDFDNSVFSTSSGDVVALTGESDRPWGTLAFRNGSTFAYGGFTENSIAKNLTFAFDDAELLLHKNRASATLAASGSGYVHYEMRGTGAVLKPASGETYTVNAKMEGTGGLVVDGEGTVAFGANSAKFAGTLDVRQGTADFSANGGAAAFTAAKGAGTVSGATMGAVRLPLTLLPDGTASNVLTFANCTFGGTVFVDLGCTEETPLAEPYPQNVLVARYTGSAPNIGMRLIGTGRRNLRGVFSVAGGEVRMSVEPTGMMLIVR